MFSICHCVIFGVIHVYVCVFLKSSIDGIVLSVFNIAYSVCVMLYICLSEGIKFPGLSICCGKLVNPTESLIYDYP